MKLIRIVLPLLAFAALCFANPASNATFSLKQPDGSSVMVRQVGDELFHFYETVDGYILQKNEQGFYTYVGVDGTPSRFVARNAGVRNQADREFLSSLNEKSIYKKMLEGTSRTEIYKLETPKFSNSPIQRLPEVNKTITQGDVRVLTILVEYSDIKFKNANPNALYNDFLNKEGFNEYYNIGSVRDYFIKSSNGLFRPTFDVYGPVAVSGTRASYRTESSSSKSYGARLIIYEALDMMKNQIDFSLYDKDGDDWVDYICLIYAGVGSNGSGVEEAIWPHMSSLDFTIELGNGKYGFRYACANEINVTAYYYDETTNIIEGIGIMVHEFSHALGLPDLYNTRYADGWDRGTPSVWDVMDQGSHNCPENKDRVTSCAPPLYSAFERMSLGWLSPVELDFEGSVKLSKIEENVAYQITNKENPDEFFLLEYRTNKGWESELPNSGLLIWHIDYLPSVWRRLIPNNDRDHLRVDIVEAGSEGFWPRESNPFPGSENVTEFDRFIFWDGRNMNIMLSDIRESEDKEYVMFNVFIESSSSVEVSSSSETPISSSEEMSSSSEDISSSSEAISSSFEIESSSSVAESSSSEIESSSSVVESSSSEIVSSSSLFESSSSNVEPESSAASSSSVEISSSSEITSSSSIVSSSSSLTRSSSSVLSSSSIVSSSSATVSSSSIRASSSSNVPGSSSRIAEMSSSSAIASSCSAISSSESLESSSSEHPVFAVHSTPLSNVRVRMHDGDIYVYAPQQGIKTVRFFSPIGTLLLETTMENSEQAIDLRSISRSNIIVSVTQGNKQLFKGIIRWNR